MKHSFHDGGVLEQRLVTTFEIGKWIHEGEEIIYWITTGLVALAITASGVPALLHGPAAVQAFEHLGNPAYFAYLLGTARSWGSVFC